MYHYLSKVILFVSIMGFLSFNAHAFEEPDFDYPQQVSKDAMSQLKKAQRAGDGQMLVDALVKFSIAKSQISQESMDTIITQIEEVKKKESRADYKALINYFEAIVFDSYKNSFGVSDRKNATNEDTSSDYTEWSNDQFDNKVKSLLMDAIDDEAALTKCPIGNYSKILTGSNELGRTYIPTLYQFLCYKIIDDMNVNDIAFRKVIRQRWVDSCPKGSAEWFYAMTETGTIDNAKEAYPKYKDYEHSALLLLMTSSWDNYQEYKDYLQRFPNSIYAAEVQNGIYNAEEQELSLTTKSHVSSSDSIKLDVNFTNLYRAKAIIYRLPDALIKGLEEGKVSKIEPKDVELFRTHDLTAAGKVPFHTYQTVKLPPLPFGRYIIVGSFVGNDGKEVVDNNDLRRKEIVKVHNMTMFSTGGEGIDDKVFTVDMRNGAPVAGATVDMTVRTQQNRQNKKLEPQITGADGSVLMPSDLSYNNSITFNATKGDDKYGDSFSAYRFTAGHHYTNQSIRVFTDLDIYRPGETVQFAAILNYVSTEHMRPVEDTQVRVIFRDPNGKNIDTLETTTDAYGRIQGEFKIPTDRMNGRFSLDFTSGEKKDYAGSHVINVSEYKTPTFTVSFPDQRSIFTRNQPVKITGKALTYSGQPVPNAQVKLNLRRNEWSWWWRWAKADGTSINDTIITTNDKGEFTIEYPESLFKENEAKYYYYNYVLEAQCTNDAGESQQNKHRFIIGGRRGLELKGDVDFNNVKPITLPLVFNSTDENEKSVECAYEIYDSNDNVVASGYLKSDKPEIDLTKLPSGNYKVRVHILGEEDGATCNLRLYRRTDKTSPIASNPLWLPSDGRWVDDKNVAHITIGNSTPEANIYYIAVSRDKVEKQGWLKYKQGMNEFTIDMPNTPGGYLYIKLYSVSNNTVFQDDVRLVGNVKERAMKIKVNSFRDKLLSGENEKWSFTLIDENEKPQSGAMILEMMDKAINDISANDWVFKPSTFSKNVYSFNNQGLYGSSYSRLSWSHDHLNSNSLDFPELNMYDTSLFPFAYRYDMLGAGGMVLYESMADAESAVPMMKSAGVKVRGATSINSAAAYDMAEAPEAAEESELEEVDEEALENVEVRLSDVKVALWKPMLVSDNQGNISLEFEAPNFNTTWIVQAIAYNGDLLTDKLNREVLTSKPVMVKSSLPRFLRQGDQAQLAASLQNSTDAALACDAIIELFNPRTGDVIERKTFKENIAASGTSTVRIDWTVPDTIPFIGFRVKAATGNFGDGEQVMIPVLPSISPVIESQPFYIDAATPSFTTRLPQFARDARVTLEYCDNPVWYCVQALPTIFSDNYHIATSLAHSLFAITLAQGIAKSQPGIKEAIDYWKVNEEDSTLVSMLARNRDLKIGTLLASPWINEADRQTLRMSRLNELFDEQLMQAEHDRIVNGLKDLQMSDGGFTWYRYPGCQSSLYTTETVLELIGELRHLGYLKDDDAINGMLKPALGYLDREYLKLYKEQLKHDKKNHSGFSSYVYTRTLYPEHAMGSENKDMIKNCLKAMTRDWKGTSLGNKAFYALTLNRNNYPKVAKDIVESIRQFALTKPETGMYWDNVQAGWRYLDKVAVTSTILEAMNEVDPRTQEIDQVRKWILLMKQTNDWGSSSLAADAVYSILSTGSKWLERNGTPTITIDGKPLEFDKVDAYLGYCRKEIPATSLATLNIERNGASPAWGAIYSQFKAEMSEIQEASVYDLSIHKEFYVYKTDGSLEKVDNFKVGDKVQVRTIIKNAKDLDYVTVKDERGSCFEPLDKLSGYRYADRTCYYLEIKDSETNIFFTSLDKGTHVISYDVYVTAPGKYNVGIATAQCQYAPQVTAHSAGTIATVEP